MKTFIDSNVLIAAATGFSKISASAFTILNDPTREFVSSPFVRLETIPKAAFHRNQLEIEFYESYFAAVSSWIDDYARLISEAENAGKKFGLNMGDALHIAAALLAQADEFVTAERPTSPLKNVVGVNVISIYQR